MAHDHDHDHDHSHDHDHAHSHGHDHAHSHDHAHAHGHVHSHSHSHAQGHAHAEPAATVGEHRHHAPTHVAAYVVTCSDTRVAEQDGSGARVRQLLEDEGHTISGHEVIPDDAAAIEAALQRAQESGARAVLFTGGTGLSRRDVTVETLERRFEKPIPGFGELFRTLSFSEIGSAAMLSRATAGVIGGVVVFAMPGSPHAAGLAMRKLILPELGHLVRELSR